MKVIMEHSNSVGIIYYIIIIICMVMCDMIIFITILVCIIREGIFHDYVV